MRVMIANQSVIESEYAVLPLGLTNRIIENIPILYTSPITRSMNLLLRVIELGDIIPENELENGLTS